jgi:hypothetical protein
VVDLPESTWLLDVSNHRGDGADGQAGSHEPLDDS